MLNDNEIKEFVESRNRSISSAKEDCLVLCTKTSKSRRPKPQKGFFYLSLKTVATKWGYKTIVIDTNGNEIWADPEYIIGIDENSNDFLKEIHEKLLKKKEDYIDSRSTPIICTVLKKNNGGIEIELPNGFRVFVSKKLIYPFSSYSNAKRNDVISISIPVWFAEKNGIIKRQENNRS